MVCCYLVFLIFVQLRGGISTYLASDLESEVGDPDIDYIKHRSGRHTIDITYLGKAHIPSGSQMNIVPVQWLALLGSS